MSYNVSIFFNKFEGNNENKPCGNDDPRGNDLLLQKIYETM